MRLRIIHETVYKFSAAVFLEPHYLRFKPKITPHRKLESFNLHVDPVPSGISEQTDPENNIVHLCWFDGKTANLKIRSESLVENQDYNPFNFILYPSIYTSTPFTYSPALMNLLNSALRAQAISKNLINYGLEIKRESDSNTIEFITMLTRQIQLDFNVEFRKKGSPYEPDRTFKLKRGSCRDLSWMQIQILRHMGIAARFVSGYYYIPLEKPDYELHAWLEVYLPGAGWIGFDPSNGIATGNSYIPISSSTQFENTMPVSGTIRGSAESDLKTNLFIEAV